MRRKRLDGPVLIQERFIKQPWRLLVSCILLNRTTGAVSRHVISRLFDIWPTPERMAEAREKDVAAVAQPCGLQNVRARRLKLMSKQWIEYAPRHAQDVSRLFGIGAYGLDSYLIFVERNRFVRPDDKRLRAFLRSPRGRRFMRTGELR